ncbi:MAG: hypothetical protein JXR03_02940 [Cyclobacteriaceae bacterium]
MAKHHRQTKQSNVVGRHGQGVSYEHQESIDDSLLPEANELASLKELDPDVMSWIKERTAKEQDARLDFNDRKMGLLEKGQKMSYRVDIIAILSAFIITMSGMIFSYILIQANQIITGSVFAGATILFAANSFLNFRKKNSSNVSTKKT